MRGFGTAGHISVVRRHTNETRAPHPSLREEVGMALMTLGHAVSMFPGRHRPLGIRQLRVGCRRCRRATLWAAPCSVFWSRRKPAGEPRPWPTAGDLGDPVRGTVLVVRGHLGPDAPRRVSIDSHAMP